MSYGYGGRANPYDQRDASPAGQYSAPEHGGYNSSQRGRYDAPQQGYNAQPYGVAPPAYGSNTQYGRAPAMGRDNYETNVEMEPLAPNGGAYQDPNAILNECQAISEGIVAIRQDLESLRRLQKRSLSDTDSSANSETNRGLDAMNSQIMTNYRGLAARIKDIKRQPESGSPKNAPQVSRVDAALKNAINEFQKIESAFQKDLKEQMARQYRVVRPDASEAEVKQAVEDTSNQQVFSQALMQSDRSGQARQAKMAVQDRHVAIQKIEKQMVELAQLFQDMEALVVQQEAAVTVIEQKGEEVVDNMHQGNAQLDTGIKSARARNRKKWWCLLIVVIIIIVIAIILAIYFTVINPPKKAAKRDLLDVALQARSVIAGQNWTPRGRSALPNTAWTPRT